MLQRLNAIAAGLLVMALGAMFAVPLSGSFWEILETARRQKEVVGTVVGREPTQVCRKTQHTSFRSTNPRCLRYESVACPVVQYQPETGKSLKLKDCFLTSSPEMKVYVRYDSATPTDARTFFEAGTTHHWLPVFLSGVPLGFAILLIVLGISHIWAGFQRREEL